MLFFGSSISTSEMIDIFRRLGFTSKEENGVITVTVPRRRIDISIEEDLIEEVRTYLWSK